MENLRVGENIKRIREFRELSQADMAGYLEVNKETYGRMERGEVDFKLQTLFDIAEKLEVPFQKLIDADAQNYFSATGSNNSNILGNNVINGPSDEVLKMLTQTFNLIKEQHVAIMELVKNK